MWIFLHKKDAKDILEIGNKVGQLENKVKYLEDRWETERIALSDIKEQVLNTIRRLEMRDKRSKSKEKSSENGSGDENSSTLGVLDPVSQRVLEKRTRRPNAVREGVHR